MGARIQWRPRLWGGGGVQQWRKQLGGQPVAWLCQTQGGFGGCTLWGWLRVCEPEGGVAGGMVGMVQQGEGGDQEGVGGV